MRISFRQLGIMTGALFLALALTWMFAPQRLMEGWGLASTPMALLLVGVARTEEGNKK